MTGFLSKKTERKRGKGKLNKENEKSERVNIFPLSSSYLLFSSPQSPLDYYELNIKEAFAKRRQLDRTGKNAYRAGKPETYSVGISTLMQYSTPPIYMFTSYRLTKSDYLKISIEKPLAISLGFL